MEFESIVDLMLYAAEWDIDVSFSQHGNNVLTTFTEDNLFYQHVFNESGLFVGQLDNDGLLVR